MKGMKFKGTGPLQGVGIYNLKKPTHTPLAFFSYPIWLSVQRLTGVRLGQGDT